MCSQIVLSFLHCTKINFDSMTNLEENKISFHARLNILHEMSKLARKIRKHKETTEGSDIEFWNQKQTALENHYKELEASLKGA